jgi:hypothetical protein
VTGHVQKIKDISNKKQANTYKLVTIGQFYNGVTLHHQKISLMFSGNNLPERKLLSLNKFGLSFGGLSKGNLHY